MELYRHRKLPHKLQQQYVLSFSGTTHVLLFLIKAVT